MSYDQHGPSGEEVFGELLRRLRKKSGLSLREAARQTGHDRGSRRLPDIEDGHCFPSDLGIAKLERLYGSPPGSLYDLKEELKSFPQGRAYRALIEQLQQTGGEPETISSAALADDGDRETSLKDRLLALLPEEFWIQHVLPAAFGFTIGIALPVLLGAPGHLSLEGLRDFSWGDSGLIVAGVIYICMILLFHNYFDAEAERLRRRGSLGAADRAIDAYLTKAGIVDADKNPRRDVVLEMAKTKGQRSELVGTALWWTFSERAVLQLCIAVPTSVVVLGVDAGPWLLYSVAVALLAFFLFYNATRHADGQFSIIRKIVESHPTQ